jgi:Cu(I)/Ag(I) efflux system periplasmic protein CusF
MKHLVAISVFATLFLGAAPLATAQMKGQVHKGTGVVTNVDRAGGKVTLKHDPIKSLNWPTMTMAFGVKDKGMLEKLAKDKKVEFEFVQQGQQLVITSIK